MTAEALKQDRTTSRQDYETPPDFLAAVAERFGELDVDLACGPSIQVDAFATDTRKAPIGLCEGKVDSLAVPWAESFDGARMWLNPPFKQVKPWARKCRDEAAKLSSGLIFLLTPSCVGTKWFLDHVWGSALVLSLFPRITFVGETHPFPKDCMLSVYGPSVTPGFDVWRWKDTKRKPRAKLHTYTEAHVTVSPSDVEISTLDGGLGIFPADIDIPDHDPGGVA